MCKYERRNLFICSISNLFGCWGCQSRHVFMLKVVFEGNFYKMECFLVFWELIYYQWTNVQGLLLNINKPSKHWNVENVSLYDPGLLQDHSLDTCALSKYYCSRQDWRWVCEMEVSVTSRPAGHLQKDA